MSAARGTASGSTSEQERRPLLPKAPRTPNDAGDEVKERTPLPLSECRGWLFAFEEVTLMPLMPTEQVLVLCLMRFAEPVQPDPLDSRSNMGLILVVTDRSPSPSSSLLLASSSRTSKSPTTLPG